MTTVRTNISFARGEITPPLHARVDLQDYAMGLATCRNFMVERQGGVANRPGTSFVCEVKDSSVGARLIPFVFNQDQTYILEFGNLYMRVIKDGAQIREGTTRAISAITNASPAHVTTAAHGYADGDEVYISGVAGMTEINNRWFKIDVTSATEFDLYEMDGVTASNSAHFGTYTSGGTSARVYEITTPYTSADVLLLDAKAQSADIIVITHTAHAPRELARTGDASWTLTTISFTPTQLPPHGVTATVGSAGTSTFMYKVTAINDLTGEESLPARGATQAITNITQANPAVVTYTGADTFANDDEIYIEGVVGMTQVNGLTFTVAGLNAGANTFQLSGVNSTAYTAYSSGGTVALTYARINSASQNPTTAHQVVIPVVAGASTYNVYKRIAAPNGGTEFGFLGIHRKIGTPASGTSTFYDGPSSKDDFDTPPEGGTDKFSAAGDYPKTATFYQQRLILAGSDNAPNTFDASRIGFIYNFTRSTPIQDDDAMTATLPGRGPNRVLHMLDIGTLVSFLDGSEWAVLGGGDQGTLTPSDVNARQYSYNGISSLFPLVVNRTALYVQARGNKVRDLLYDFQSNGYDGSELSIKSAHLLDGFTIADWAYQQNPQSIVWMCRSDGALLGLTYVRDEAVIAWHRHDTDGSFERVAVAPEGTEDATYVIVQRTLTHPDSGLPLTKRYIERLDSREWTEVADAKHLDSSLSYDGRNPHPTNTVTINPAGTFAEFSTSYDITQVGNELHVRGADGLVVKAAITAVAAPARTFAIVTDRVVPASIASTPLSTWSYAVDEVSGLWHLEGKEVGIFADGFVIASPNNATIDTFTVTNGTLALPAYFSVIHVGLPFISDLGTLDIDRFPGTLANKAKLISALNVWVHETRGLWMGIVLPDDDDPVQGLREVKARSTEGYDLPPALETTVLDQSISGGWNSNGRIAIRVIDPVPARVLAIAPAGIVVP